MEFEIILAIAALAAGGILKGATGAGAPIIAVPVLAILYDVPYAVSVFVVPNLVTNLWQWWQYRKHGLSRGFVVRLCAGGALGVVAGTNMLVFLPQQALLMAVGLVVVLYIGFRLARPGWTLSFERAFALSAPTGFAGGMLQGASGVSAPISITFLNAMRLDRPVFISTISAYFVVMTVAQIPTLASLGILTVERLLHGVVALALLLAFMPVGSALARKIRKETFDKLILVLLGVIAAKILVTPIL